MPLAVPQGSFLWYKVPKGTWVARASWVLLSQALQEGWQVAGAMAMLQAHSHPCIIYLLGSCCCLPTPPRVSRQGRSQQATEWVVVDTLLG